MIQTIKQKTIVRTNGKVEISQLSLGEGALVEVTASVKPLTVDETEYLLSSQANRQQLKQAIANVESGKNLFVITPEEWNQKYNL